LHLKPNSVREFTDTIENEVTPLLRKQKGFQDEITFVVPGGTEAVGISLWDQKESAEAYNRGTYPQVQKTLAKVVEGTPEIKTYEVANSTFHKIPLASQPEATRSFFLGGGGQVRLSPAPPKGKFKIQEERGFECLQES
jgi:hypothetical protein